LCKLAVKQAPTCPNCVFPQPCEITHKTFFKLKHNGSLSHVQSAKVMKMSARKERSHSIENFLSCLASKYVELKWQLGLMHMFMPYIGIKLRTFVIQKSEHIFFLSFFIYYLILTILLICVVLLSCYHCEAALIQSVL